MNRPINAIKLDGAGMIVKAMSPHACRLPPFNASRLISELRRQGFAPAKPGLVRHLLDPWFQSEILRICLTMSAIVYGVFAFFDIGNWFALTRCNKTSGYDEPNHNAEAQALLNHFRPRTRASNLLLPPEKRTSEQQAAEP